MKWKVEFGSSALGKIAIQKLSGITKVNQIPRQVNRSPPQLKCSFLSVILWSCNPSVGMPQKRQLDWETQMQHHHQPWDQSSGSGSKNYIGFDQDFDPCPTIDSFNRACARSSSCDWAASVQRGWLADSVVSPDLQFPLGMPGEKKVATTTTTTTAGQNGVSPRPTCILSSGNPTSSTYMCLSTSIPQMGPKWNLKDLLWSIGWSPQLSRRLCRPQLELRRRSWPPRRPPQTHQPRLYVICSHWPSWDFAGGHFTHMW